jgi:geranylgeranyl diphosphate synthase type II
VEPRTTDQALQQLLDEGRARASATAPDHALLWESLAAATEGGKRFRPALVTATHDALGGTCPGAAVEVGAAVELLHTAFVIHDDVIDGDDLRRGRLNVSGTFRARPSAPVQAPDDADDFGPHGRHPGRRPRARCWPSARSPRAVRRPEVVAPAARPLRRCPPHHRRPES